MSSSFEWRASRRCAPSSVVYLRRSARRTRDLAVNPHIKLRCPSAVGQERCALRDVPRVHREVPVPRVSRRDDGVMPALRDEERFARVELAHHRRRLAQRGVSVLRDCFVKHVDRCHILAHLPSEARYLSPAQPCPRKRNSSRIHIFWRGARSQRRSRWQSRREPRKSGA